MRRIRRKIGSYTVPILNSGAKIKKKARDAQKATWNALSHLAVVKPERQFGATWTSDKVHHAQGVVMCEFCWRKYYGWWKREGYRPNWDMRFSADCDGCSARGVHTVLMLPEEKFYEVLTRSHGRYPEPNRKVFSA